MKTSPAHGSREAIVLLFCFHSINLINEKGEAAASLITEVLCRIINNCSIIAPRLTADGGCVIVFTPE